MFNLSLCSILLWKIQVFLFKCYCKKYCPLHTTQLSKKIWKISTTGNIKITQNRKELLTSQSYVDLWMKSSDFQNSLWRFISLFQLPVDNQLIFFSFSCWHSTTVFWGNLELLSKYLTHIYLVYKHGSGKKECCIRCEVVSLPQNIQWWQMWLVLFGS